MFIAEIFNGAPKNAAAQEQTYLEATGPQVIVLYPGRFQPFHLGHRDVFESLQAKYGRDNVFIATSNKVELPKSPFNFTEKVAFMTAAGVPADRILEVKSPYVLPAQFDPANTIFIVAVGAPDADRLKPGSYKKDGSAGYYQNFEGVDKSQTADKHGYVIIASEREKVITLGGKKYDASHGTESRALWNMVRGDGKLRAEYLTQMFGRNDPELAKILDKIPVAENSNMPVAVDSTSPVGGKLEEVSADPRYLGAAERSRSVARDTQRQYWKSPEEKAAARRTELKRDAGIAGYTKRHRAANPDMYPTPKAHPAPKLRDPSTEYSDDYSTWAAGRRDTVEQVAAESSINEEAGNMIIRRLIAEFNEQMSGSPYYPLDYKNPGMRMWTRGDGSRYKDPGYIFIDRDLKPEDQPKWHKAKAIEKFWNFLSTKGARKIGDVSGEFGSDPHSPAVLLNKLVFVFNGRSISWGSTSRLKNSSVWRQKEQTVSEEAAGVGVVSNSKDPRYVMATTGIQNDVTAETLPKAMKAFGLTGRKAPSAKVAEAADILAQLYYLEESLKEDK